MIHAYLGVVNETCPALAVVFYKQLLPEDSESSKKLQATLQIETFSELLDLWTSGMSPEEQTKAMPYFLEILEHHLTEKGTDDFHQFSEEGHILLEQSIFNYNTIASHLAIGDISLEDAVTLARLTVMTPKLQHLETDLKKLFNRMSENPTLLKRIGMRWYDWRHSSHLDQKKGQISLHDALEDPNTFIMMANLQAINKARENIIDVDEKTDYKLRELVFYTLKMLSARYSGGNNLLEDLYVPVETALEHGTDTVLIGYTYGMGLLARASADPQFLEAIENDQFTIIEAISDSARVIREMNDASPTALTVWGENEDLALQTLAELRQQVGSELPPKEFFKQLRVDAEKDPELQKYVDMYARQVVDAGQGEYNIGLFASTDSLEPNTWESFVHNIRVLSQDYATTRKRLWENLQKMNKDAADFIGQMIGYHDGLYRFAKGDFDEERDIVDLTMHCAKKWRDGFSPDKSKQLEVFEAMLQTAIAQNQTKKQQLLSGLLMTLN